MQTINISVTQEQKKLVDKLVEKLDFANRSELIRTLLRRVEASPEVLKEPKIVKLSPKAAKRYDRMVEEIESGKAKTKTFNSVDDLMEDLVK